MLCAPPPPMSHKPSFLERSVDRDSHDPLPNPEENFRLYKALFVHFHLLVCQRAKEDSVSSAGYAVLTLSFLIVVNLKDYQPRSPVP